ncbi:hypothetical protein OL548_27735 [Lysinibacillus sp. MHQ-1]|nr:hypothetical protein OL548_27735 [Lysinibacillus sp. MHQ-1]
MEKQLRKFTELIGFRYFIIIILILTGCLQFGLMYGNVKGVTYDFKPLQLAPETVRSTKTIEDTYKTQQEREKSRKCSRPGLSIFGGCRQAASSDCHIVI